MVEIASEYDILPFYREYESILYSARENILYYGGWFSIKFTRLL
jgi:hypothetical protein